MNVYFDNAASTMVRDEAIEAMNRVMSTNYGNPSSMHAFGRQAKTELENARSNIADAMGAQPGNIYFTSGGTEANNLAIFGAADKLSRKGKHIITSAIEHSAVLDPIKKLEKQGWEVSYLEPDLSGCITVNSFCEALREDTVFASIMFVNNETGVINPVNEYAQEIKNRKLKTLLHTDAIQAFCKVPFMVNELGADLISISSHKIHGPKGAGALYIKDGIKISPLLLGGSHEKGLRGGTEALPAAVGFGEAAKFGLLELNIVAPAVNDIRKYLRMRLHKNVPGIVFLSDAIAKIDSTFIKEVFCSPFILPLSLPGYKSEVLMNFLDGEGICVSKSAACKKGARSRTLEAMRLKNEVIDGALRISFSRYSTKDEADYFVKALKTASETLCKAW